MLYREYDQETLKKLQKIELGILKDFDALCTKYDLNYFVCGGSLIGTVRHEGFIPWDDDIDVGMPRKDYEKFLKIARKPEYSAKYSILNAETQPDYPLMTTRWCKRGTVFQEESMKNVDAEFGIFLDMFCFDNIPDQTLLMKIQAWRAWFWGKLRILYSVDEPVLYFGGIKAKIVVAVCKFANKVLRALPISPSGIYRHAKRISAAYWKHQTKRVNFLHDPKPYLSTIDRDQLLPTKRMRFEDMMVCVPANPNAYLTQRFGPDYMTLPPEDKRHNHPPYHLDLGETNS